VLTTGALEHHPEMVTSESLVVWTSTAKAVIEVLMILHELISDTSPTD